MPVSATTAELNPKTEGSVTMSGAQAKAARNLLGWQLYRVARAVGVNQAEMAAIENGKSMLSAAQSSLAQKCFEAAGVEFVSENATAGLRLRKSV
jgi:transcriptional regulator with XRE-family HTH domain